MQLQVGGDELRGHLGVCGRSCSTAAEQQQQQQQLDIYRQLTTTTACLPRAAMLTVCVRVCRAVTGLSHPELSCCYSLNVGGDVVDLGAVLVSHHHSLSGSGVSSEHHAVLHKTHTRASASLQTSPQWTRLHRPTYLTNTHLKDEPTDGGSGLPSRRKAVSYFGSFSFQICISENKNFNSLVMSE